jgi:hypothetical protein
MSDKMVEEMARAMAEVIAKRHGHAPENWLNDQRREEAQAAATIAERRMEKMREHRLAALTLLYQIAPQTTARLCDEDLDRSGALLGKVRELSTRAAKAKGAKTLTKENCPAFAEYERAMREEVIPAIERDLKAQRRAAHFLRLGIPDPLAASPNMDREDNHATSNRG